MGSPTRSTGTAVVGQPRGTQGQKEGEEEEEEGREEKTGVNGENMDLLAQRKVQKMASSEE